MKTQTLHRHIHPIQWHGSMYLAIAALLVTVSKTSGEMIRFLEANTAAPSSISATVLRNAETIHSGISLGSFSRAVVTSGE